MLWGQVIPARGSTNVPTICVAGDTDSGSSLTKRADIATSVLALQNAGCFVIGYVDTRYGARALQDCLNDAVRWKDFYNVDGIFWDEVGTGHAAYYQSLVNYVANWGGGALNVGNPGDTSTNYTFFSFMITREQSNLDPSFTGNYIAFVSSLPATFPTPDWFWIG